MQPLIITQSKGETRVMNSVRPPLFDMTINPEITLCLMQPEYDGANAKVTILINSADSGTIVTEMSLEDFFKSAMQLVYQAEVLWNYPTPVDKSTDQASKEKHIKRIKQLLDSYVNEES